MTLAIQTFEHSLTPQGLMGRIATILIVARNHGTVEVAPADIKDSLESYHLTEGVRASIKEIRQALRGMEEVGIVVFKKNLVRLPK